MDTRRRQSSHFDKPATLGIYSCSFPLMYAFDLAFARPDANVCLFFRQFACAASGSTAGTNEQVVSRPRFQSLTRAFAAEHNAPVWRCLVTPFVRYSSAASTSSGSAGSDLTNTRYALARGAIGSHQLRLVPRRPWFQLVDLWLLWAWHASSAFLLVYGSFALLLFAF